MRRSGFTLIEVLIAVSMLAMVAMLVRASFRTIMYSLDSVREEAEISRAAESIMWFAASELNNALMADGLYFQGAGEDGSDEIFFYSTAAYPRSGDKDLSRVSYREEEGDLWKGVDGEYFRAAGGLESFSIRYYDGGEWIEEWDSESRGRLPPAAEILIEIGGREFRRIASFSVNAEFSRIQQEAGR